MGHTYKAPGPDGIQPTVLQNLPKNALTELIWIYRKSLQQGQVPKAWREMKLVFIPKPGKKAYETAKSLGLIALSNFMLKALERIIQWKIQENHVTRLLIWSTRIYT